MKDFANLEKKYSSLLSNLIYSISCPIEWYDIIEDMLFNIDKYAHEKQLTIKILNIKMKFNGLRCYVDYTDIHLDHVTVIEGYISRAQNLLGQKDVI